ncbi:MAG: DUF4364 family protein [Lachnospiraceae bacterium]|nr:DUF4364 family protein [Lachnospiraceae bacterium]
MKDTLAIYKLIVLFMLDRVEFPLTKAQIGDFILEKEYTNFMTLQAVMSDLVDDKLVIAESYRNRTHLKITAEGRQTIGYFVNEINPEIRNEIDAFLKENSLKFRNEVSIIADYYKSTTGEWEAHLIAKDKNINLVDMTLSVPTEENAISICDNWNKKNQRIYRYLIKELF